MRAVCDALAAQGYAALCPDIFWRIEPGIQITDKTEAEWKRAFELFNLFDVDKGIGDLKAGLAQLRHHPACTGKAGSVGYCLGGKLAYLMATRSDVDCSVGYYGVGIQDLVGEAKSIKKPLALHMAEKDQFVPPPAQEAIKQALKGNPADHALQLSGRRSRVRARRRGALRCGGGKPGRTRGPRNSCAATWAAEGNAFDPQGDSRGRRQSGCGR